METFTIKGIEHIHTKTGKSFVKYHLAVDLCPKVDNNPNKQGCYTFEFVKWEDKPSAHLDDIVEPVYSRNSLGNIKMVDFEVLLNG